MDAKGQEDKQVSSIFNISSNQSVGRQKLQYRDPHRAMKKKEECEICEEII